MFLKLVSYVSKLAINNRIDYCESLIYRTKKDYLSVYCRLERKGLEKLHDLIHKELQKLKN